MTAIVELHSRQPGGATGGERGAVTRGHALWRWRAGASSTATGIVVDMPRRTGSTVIEMGDPAPAHTAATSASTAGALRPVCVPASLVRRRRLALTLWGLLLVVGAARSVGAVADWAVGGVPPPPPTADRLYVVQPGDTLWEIARTLQPRGDVRPLVDRLVQLNGGAEVRAGDVLELRW